MTRFEYHSLRASQTRQAAAIVRDIARLMKPRRTPPRTRRPRFKNPPPQHQPQRGDTQLHPRWRRITGITVAVEATLPARARRAGIRRLIAWIERAWANGARGAGVSPALSAGFRGAGVSPACSVAVPAPCATNGAETPPRRLDADPMDDPIAEHNISVTKTWNLPLEAWSHSRLDEPSIEALCHDLQIVPARLDRLLREHSNFSARDLIDGFRVRKLRKAMFERLRDAALLLWGRPGDYAHTMLVEYAREVRSAAPGAAAPLSYVDSPLPPREERAEEIHRRTNELADRMRDGFDARTWAAVLGFDSPARLNAAVRRIFGLNLRQFERILACDIVRYYIAREDKVMREVAASPDGGDPRTRCARHLYCKSDESPLEPFRDEYAKAELFSRTWLEWMNGAFG